MSEIKFNDNHEMNIPKTEGFRNIKPENGMTKLEAKEILKGFFDKSLGEHNKEYKQMLSGEKIIRPDDSNIEKGNKSEIMVDKFLSSLGYERVSLERVKTVEDPTHQGIDGVYYRKNGKPEYLIVDTKYGFSQLSDTLDGKQMSWNWIDKRLDQAAGKATADKIRNEKLDNPNNVGCFVAHVYSTDKVHVSFDKLDDSASVCGKNAERMWT